jgi:hypothetical protein
MITTTETHVGAKDAFLRFAMRLDAVVSGVMGIAGLALAPKIAELSGTTPVFEYSMSAFFVAYGIAVFAASRMASVRIPGIVVTVGNAGFTVAAIAVVLAGVWPLTTTGIVLTLGSGVFTLVMADLQYLGLRRLRA